MYEYIDGINHESKQKMWPGPQSWACLTRGGFEGGFALKHVLVALGPH